MKQLHFTLEGTLPLLQHNIRSMQDGEKILPPEEAAELASYTLPDGSLCMPAAAVRNALLRAAVGKQGRDERTKKKVPMSRILPGAVLFADDWFPLVDGEGNPIREYKIDIRSVHIQGRGRVPRARARIDLPWYLVCTFGYDPEIVPPSIIEELLNDAGRTVGIGDFRLERKGAFGGFRLASLEVK